MLIPFENLSTRVVRPSTSPMSRVLFLEANTDYLLVIIYKLFCNVFGEDARSPERFPASDLMFALQKYLYLQSRQEQGQGQGVEAGAVKRAGEGAEVGTRAGEGAEAGAGARKGAGAEGRGMGSRQVQPQGTSRRIHICSLTNNFVA